MSSTQSAETIQEVTPPNGQLTAGAISKILDHAAARVATDVERGALKEARLILAWQRSSRQPLTERDTATLRAHLDVLTPAMARMARAERVTMPAIAIDPAALIAAEGGVVARDGSVFFPSESEAGVWWRVFNGACSCRTAHSYRAHTECWHLRVARGERRR